VRYVNHHVDVMYRGSQSVLVTTTSAHYGTTKGIYVTAKPGKTVWIEAATGMASYTGDFAFTSDGVHYVVKNVTITQPAAPDADSLATTSYRVMQVDSATQAGLPADTTGGVAPINSLPVLQNYIDQGH